MFSNDSMSPADLGAIMGNSNNGFGGDGAWLWFIIILVALFNGNGFGFGNNNSSGAYDNYVLASDFATLQRQIDNATSDIKQQGNAIANGISSLGYDQLSQMNGINQNISNTGFSIQNAIQNDTIANMQNTNALQSQLSSCCCENRQNIADIKYTMATDTCAINTNNTSNTRDIIDNANANTKSILDFLVQDKMATLQSENEALRLQASQQAQNTYLVNALRPSPVPAYTVANPYYYYGGTTIS